MPNHAYIPREERSCSVCFVLEDEMHVIFDCVRFNEIRKKTANYNIQMFLNPSVAQVKRTAMYLHQLEKVIFL